MLGGDLKQEARDGAHFNRLHDWNRKLKEPQNERVFKQSNGTADMDGEMFEIRLPSIDLALRGLLSPICVP